MLLRTGKGYEKDPNIGFDGYFQLVIGEIEFNSCSTLKCRRFSFKSLKVHKSINSDADGNLNDVQLSLTGRALERDRNMKLNILLVNKLIYHILFLRQIFGCVSSHRQGSQFRIAENVYFLLN